MTVKLEVDERTLITYLYLDRDNHNLRCIAIVDTFFKGYKTLGLH